MDICGLSILIHARHYITPSSRGDNMITYRFYHFVPKINMVGNQWNCLLQTIPEGTHVLAFLH